MASSEQLVAARNAAGAAYASAVATYVAAWKELAAYDAALSGGLLQLVPPLGFNTTPQTMQPISHAEFMPRQAIDELVSPSPLHLAVSDRTQQIIKSWSAS